MIEVYIDGSAMMHRTKYRKAGAAVIVKRAGETLFAKAWTLQNKSCTEAEFEALNKALEWLRFQKLNDPVVIFSDSEPLVKAMTGKAKLRKDHMRKLAYRIHKLIDEAGINCRFRLIKSQDNPADAYAKQAAGIYS